MVDKPAKCWKLWAPTKMMFLAIFLGLLTLVLCSSILLSNKYTGINGIWDGSVIVSSSANCRGRQPASLPRGIVQSTSDLELKPLSKSDNKIVRPAFKSLLAIAAGIQQKDGVDKIVKKFPASNFTILIFHYDGIVEGWNDLPWAVNAIHIAALNQTKWWFAKRFMHPDVMSSYEYLFIWDEDLGVDYFNADRYLAIVKEEGLEISQPALEPRLSSEVHHRITIRNRKAKLHRRIIRGKEFCSVNSTRPPCTGWVEMMAPVFSRAAWRCAWHLIQNDLVHGWGMDMKLGYCAQGNPVRSVGVVDSEYIVHKGIPTLGGGGVSPKTQGEAAASDTVVPAPNVDGRMEVRKRAHAEMDIFRRRWAAAVKGDICWSDPFDHL